MNESYVTVAGNLTADPVLRTTKAGKPFATFRLASTTRRWDGRAQGFVDGATTFFSVVTFNALAANVVASLTKGQPALVHGRLRVNTWSTADGRSTSTVEIDASHVGHDLTWGQSHFTKAPRAQFDTTDRLAEPEIQEAIDADLIASGSARTLPEEDIESDWRPLGGPIGEEPGDPRDQPGDPRDEPSATDSPWGQGDPETDAYVLAGAR